MARKLSPGTHTIRIKKPGGGTRLQRVNVLKSGKFKFIKNVKGGAKPKKTAAKPRGKTGRTSPKKQGGKPRMAKRKSSMVSRVINLALLALVFARPLQILFDGGNVAGKLDRLLTGATAGFNKGGLDKGAALQFYGPVAAGFILFEVKKMAMKKFRF